MRERFERRITVVEPSGTRVPDAPPAEARKAWVPVTVQVLTPPLAERLGLAGRTGVRVTQVYDAALPLRVGDIILETLKARTSELHGRANGSDSSASMGRTKREGYM